MNRARNEAHQGEVSPNSGRNNAVTALNTTQAAYTAQSAQPVHTQPASLRTFGSAKKRSKVSVLALLTAAIAGAGILAACGGAGANAGNAAPTPAPAVAQRKAVSAEGSIVPASQAKLAFQIGGRIVSAAPSGQPVRAGDVLAQLDTRDLQATLRAAEEDLVLARAQEAQAREASMPQQIEAAAASVRAGRSRLAEVQNGPREAERRTAEAAVEQAIARLKDVSAKREQIESPARAADVEAAKSSLEKAQRDAEAARARLAQLERGATTDELASARSAVERAAADLATSRASLKQLQDGPTAAEVAGAQSQLDQARTKLAQLRDAPHVAHQDVANARLAISQAEVALDKARQDFNDPALVGPERALSRQAAREVVRNAEYQVQIAQNTYDKLAGSAPTDWEYRLAEVAVAGAQASLDKVMLPPTAEERTRAQAQVTAGEAALVAAQAKLARVQQGSDDADLVAARGTAIAAEAGITAAQARLDQVIAGATLEERTSSAASVEAAQADLGSAQAKLDQLLGGSTVAEKDQAASTVAEALASEAQTRRGPTEAALQAAAAKTKRAEVSLEQARLGLEHATLRAPFDGVITSVSVRQGEYVAPGTVGITVADLTVLKVETKDLDEAAAARVRDGQEVAVTVTALDRKVITGVVRELSSQPTINQSGDVFYTATIVLPQTDPALRWGMTVRVDFK
jgi:HlyD family secretion protein